MSSVLSSFASAQLQLKDGRATGKYATKNTVKLPAASEIGALSQTTVLSNGLAFTTALKGPSIVQPRTKNPTSYVVVSHLAIKGGEVGDAFLSQSSALQAVIPGKRHNCMTSNRGLPAPAAATKPSEQCNSNVLPSDRGCVHHEPGVHRSSREFMEFCGMIHRLAPCRTRPRSVNLRRFVYRATAATHIQGAGAGPGLAGQLRDRIDGAALW